MGTPLTLLPDLDAGEAHGTDPVEFGDGQVEVLEGYGTEALQLAGGLNDHLGNLVVDVPKQIGGGFGVHPVGKQLWHGGDRLDIEAHLGHVGEAARRAPGTVGHRAVDPAVDHDVAMAGMGLGHGGPAGQIGLG